VCQEQNNVGVGRGQHVMSGILGGEQTRGAVSREWRRSTDNAQMEKKEGASFLRLGDGMARTRRV
jgi:hypothetical protein